MEYQNIPNDPVYTAIKGAAKWYPGQNLPDTDCEDYILYGKIHSHGDIQGLKEFEVDPLDMGDKFYIPLPKEVGGDMNEQKFLIGIAKKAIPATKITLGPYIPLQFSVDGPKVPVMTRCANFVKNMAGIQVLTWHDATKDTPEVDRVVLIKVPGRPWIFHGKGDIKQKVAYMDMNHVFKEFGPGDYDYSEVSEWAYLSL